MSVALDVQHLSVRFGERRILADLSFQVPAGSSLAILGPNGAGKTVLFRALIGSIPSDGSIVWAPDTRIGYVPQKLDIERDMPMTGLDLLRARTALARDITPRVEIAQALALVGMTRAVAEQPIGTLSTGQFQRILVAMALVSAPNVLLLDEPTAGLDEPGQEQLNALVHRLQQEQNLTVLFISHELNVISQYATNVLCLGRSHVCLGPPTHVLTPDVLREMYGTSTDYHVHGH
jgi:zinc transport system ATP-binding protein